MGAADQRVAVSSHQPILSCFRQTAEYQKGEKPKTSSNEDVTDTTSVGITIIIITSTTAKIPIFSFISSLLLHVLALLFSSTHSFNPSLFSSCDCILEPCWAGSGRSEEISGKDDRVHSLGDVLLLVHSQTCAFVEHVPARKHACLCMLLDMLGHDRQVHASLRVPGLVFCGVARLDSIQQVARGAELRAPLRLPGSGFAGSSSLAFG